MDSTTASGDHPHYRRFLDECQHLAGPFGAGDFGRKAETFARFFGTPFFLVAQTLVVMTWIVVNAVWSHAWDLYPFILLNLLFSTQAAYAAPLILLAQTRQAERDKAHADADARHREEVAAATFRRQEIAVDGIDLLKKLLDENTRLTAQVEAVTRQIQGKLLA